MNPEQFGRFLYLQRKAKGLTQNELAEKIHVTPSAISKWERGLCLPEMTKLSDLAKALDLSLVELIDCKKKTEPYTAQQIDRTIDTAITISSSQRTKNLLFALAGFRFVCLILYARIIGYNYNLRPLRIYYGYSEIHDKEEIEEAYRLVQTDFVSMQRNGCRLLELDYAGDEISQRDLQEYNSYHDGEPYTDCITVKTKFLSPLKGGGAWSRHTLYGWSWIIIKDSSGVWRVLTRGYG